ncbi:MAG: glycosyltransferase family 4 protein [Candidatus Hodarchaeota archaeon]
MSNNYINSDNYNNSKPKILHILYASLPYISGYSIRSHFILKHQKNFVHPFALTNPEFFRKKEPDIIENITYFRFPPDLGYTLFFKPRTFQRIKVANFYKWFYYHLLKTSLIYLQKVVEIKKIELIHAHSIGDFSKYVEKIAKNYKLPYIYEIRGFLEDTRVGLGILKEKSRSYMKRQKKITSLIKKVDLIITLGKSMKEELINRGIREDLIKIVPNGVDTIYLCPKPPNINLKQKLGINKKYIIGYIGSVRRIEGIEVLIKAMKILIRKNISVHLLIIGRYNLSYYKELKIISKKLGIEKDISFIGSVPHSKIREYYSFIDIIVIPRKNIRVNRLVTPLKPLEGMAMGKVVLTSDLPALRELVKPNISGDLFESGNYEGLANKLIYYISNSEARDNLGKKAREFVENNFAWSTIIKKYISIYNQLLN